MKKDRSKNISYDTLDKVIDFADSIIADNPDMTYKDFTIDQEYDWGDASHPVLEYETEETEFEKIQREKQEIENQARREKHEREQFEKLKKKFGESK
jgi:hypothetical protein